MSAAGLGPRQGGEHDFYRTPEWVVVSILPHLDQRILRHGLILEPSAGDGAIIKALQPKITDLRQVMGIEIRSEGVAQLSELGIGLTMEGDAVWQMEHMAKCWDERPSLVIANPPFKDAIEHLRAAIQVVAPGGQVAFLLRLAFLAGKKRVSFHQEFAGDVYVLPRRPSFTGKGTDSSDYMWWVWRKPNPAHFTPLSFGKWRVLDPALPAAFEPPPAPYQPELTDIQQQWGGE